MTETIEPGDILLLVDETSHGVANHALMIGDNLENFNLLRKDLENATVHRAVIWVKALPHEPAIVETDDEGFIRANALRPGTYLQFRPRDRQLGRLASRIALAWALGIRVDCCWPTDAPDAAKESAFGRAPRLETVDPIDNPCLTFPRWGVLGSYCSQLIVSAYQAAAGILRTPFCGMLTAAASTISRQELLRRLLMDDFHFTCDADVTISTPGAACEQTLYDKEDGPLVAV